MHTQRKRYDLELLAKEAAEGFMDSDFKALGVVVTATYREEGGHWWVYVTQNGDIVGSDDPVLPGYERVG